MKSRLLNLLTMLSLLLCVAVCVLWVQSYGRGCHLIAASAERDGPLVCCRFRGIGSSHGVVRLFAGEARDGEQKWRHLRQYVEAGLPEPARGWRLSLERDPPRTRLLAARARTVETAEFGGLGRRRSTLVSAVYVGYDRTDRTIPHAYLATLFFLAPALWLSVAARTRLRRRSRRLRGLCARCGYDLRATPGQCPECGRAALAPSQP